MRYPGTSNVQCLSELCCTASRTAQDSKKGITVDEMKSRAQNREKWREMIVKMRDKVLGAGQAVT